MFVTPDAVKVSLPPQLRRPGEQVWWAVYWKTEVPHFQVCLSIKERDTVSSTCAYMALDSLMDSFRDDDPSILRIASVRIMSPSWMNGSDSWQMDSVDRIEKGVHRESGIVHIFRLADGRTFYGLPGADPNLIADIQLVAELCTSR